MLITYRTTQPRPDWYDPLVADVEDQCCGGIPAVSMLRPQVYRDEPKAPRTRVVHAGCEARTALLSALWPCLLALPSPPQLRGRPVSAASVYV